MSELSSQSKETESSYDAELDIASTEFNPLRALYAAPEYRVSAKEPKVVYQNLAAFESALKKFGIWNLNKRKHKETSGTSDSTTTNPSSSSSSLPKPKSLAHLEEDETNARRFQPHQMAVKGSIKTRHQRNLYTHMASAEGPIAHLRTCLKEAKADDGVVPRVRVLLRKKDGIRGCVEGELVAFDKQWNLLLRNVIEIWRRRKFKYGEQKYCGTPQDCSKQLSRLGITLPKVQVRSINRKNVEVRRELPQILVRGEQVILINMIEKKLMKLI